MVSRMHVFKFVFLLVTCRTPFSLLGQPKEARKVEKEFQLPHETDPEVPSRGRTEA